jgi:uncharacterized membrane protein YfcA
MSIHEAIFLFTAALVAGVLNSVAGGGGFIAFPALVVTGIPPINANATNTAALWPGTVASTGAYRNVLSREDRTLVLPLVVTGAIGGLIGAIVLLKTPQQTFLRLIPWLLLSATLLFCFSRRITRWIRERRGGETGAGHLSGASGALVQLVIALYIGYFGAGAGILMLALFALMGVENIHTMNGLKTLMASVCNAIALIAFIVARAIVWPQAILMVVGAAIGGYAGAYYAQKLPPERVRQFVIVTGFAMSAYFFVR